MERQIIFEAKSERQNIEIDWAGFLKRPTAQHLSSQTF